MFHVHTFNEAGGHPVNEDSFGVRPHPVHQAFLYVALADGMGGQPGGGRAASLAVQATLDLGTRRTDPWPRVLSSVDEMVCDDQEAGYTTLVGLCACNGTVLGASCGDSAALALDRTGVVKELTRNQWKNPPVGSREATFIPFNTSLVPPWKPLVMSDGVWKYVGWERLIEAAKKHDGPALVQSLQDAARLKGSGTFHDDFTLIVIQDAD